MAITVEQAVDNYLTDLTLEGKSPETILWHRKKLSAFCRFLQNGKDPAKVSDLTLEDGRAFVKWLMERKTRYSEHVIRKEVEGGLAPQTVHGFVRSIRTFASWLQSEGYSEDHVFQGLKPPKLPQILIQPLTEDEIRKLLLVIPQDTPEGVRNLAMVMLYLDTGIRLSELVNLKLSDIDFVAGQFKVFGKGAKERIVPMGLSTRRAVIRCRDHFRPQPVNPNEARLFLNVAGEPISKDSVEKMIQRLARRAQIPGCTPTFCATRSPCVIW